jgi:hypothetical protein
VSSAAVVSAGVKVQWPPRCTYACRSSQVRPAARTARWYACSAWTGTRPSPVVCTVSSGVPGRPVKATLRIMYRTATGSALIRGAAASAARSAARDSPARAYSAATSARIEDLVSSRA